MDDKQPEQPEVQGSQQMSREEVEQLYLALIGEMAEGEPKLGEDGRLTDLDQALLVIHELAIMLHQMAVHPLVALMFGPAVTEGGSLAATAAHFVSCPHKGEGDDRWEPSKPLQP